MVTGIGLENWLSHMETNSSAGRFSCQNILHYTSGPAAFAATRVHKNEATASRLFSDESMVRHVCKCTTKEGRRMKGKDWNVKPAEMD